jgi:excisionase family DNA binding protein
VFFVFVTDTVPVTSNDLLSTGEVARLLGCSRQHVVDLCSQGKLPYVSVGTHRRVRRADAIRLSGDSLQRDQERSLWLHRAVAGHMAADPTGVIARARENLRRLRQVHADGASADWLDRWETLLRAGPDAVFDALTLPADWAVELRQNSPFAGVLEPAERHAVLASFREHWRETHAA